MKKLFILFFFLYCLAYSTFGQLIKKDSATYAPKSLKLDEVNLVTSYYSHTGDHSTTLGGIGDESVKEMTTAIDLKFVGYKNPNYIHSLTAGLGFAFHTAASQAWISATGASRKNGTRIFPSLEWSMRDVNKKAEYSAGLMYSNEFNYQSLTLDAGYSKGNSKNGEFALKFSGSFDQVKMIYAEEMAKTDVQEMANTQATLSSTTIGNTVLSSQSILKSAASSSGSSGSSSGTSSEEGYGSGSKPRTTLTGGISYNQVINPQMQVAFLADFTGQFGYLELPFHRVFASDADSSTIENLPDTRLRLPLAVRLNYFLGDRYILRTYYRFYTDNWGITAHTANLEVPVKLSPFFSVSPFYRFYTQTASKYFAPFAEHTTSDEYYTSNYSYSAFTANSVGAGLRWLPKEGGFFKTIELRYTYYKQTTGLAANAVTLNLKF
ncbi:MAG: hypothetical protein H6Q14_2508 [Bacteroidetes bacterium]|nr:hypothetical protein [Bacteroidota bacterium]